MNHEQCQLMSPSIDHPVIKVRAKNLDFLPFYASDGAAGADIRAHIENEIVLTPGSFQLIPTGLYFEIPPGYEIQVRPRSGLALKHGITVLNSPGTIDSDYRGELGIILVNFGKIDFLITSGMRIAQIIVSPVTKAIFTLTEEELTQSARGHSGFGHSGTH